MAPEPIMQDGEELTFNGSVNNGDVKRNTSSNSKDSLGSSLGGSLFSNLTNKSGKSNKSILSGTKSLTNKLKNKMGSNDGSLKDEGVEQNESGVASNVDGADGADVNVEQTEGRGSPLLAGASPEEINAATKNYIGDYQLDSAERHRLLNEVNEALGPEEINNGQCETIGETDGKTYDGTATHNENSTFWTMGTETVGTDTIFSDESKTTKHTKGTKYTMATTDSKTTKYTQGTKYTNVTGESGTRYTSFTNESGTRFTTYTRNSDASGTKTDEDETEMGTYYTNDYDDTLYNDTYYDDEMSSGFFTVTNGICPWASGLCCPWSNEGCIRTGMVIETPCLACMPSSIEDDEKINWNKSPKMKDQSEGTVATTPTVDEDASINKSIVQGSKLNANASASADTDNSKVTNHPLSVKKRLMRLGALHKANTKSNAAESTTNAPDNEASESNPPENNANTSVPTLMPNRSLVDEDESVYTAAETQITKPDDSFVELKGLLGLSEVPPDSSTADSKRKSPSPHPHLTPANAYSAKTDKDVFNSLETPLINNSANEGDVDAESKSTNQSILEDLKAAAVAATAVVSTAAVASTSAPSSEVSSPAPVEPMASESSITDPTDLAREMSMATQTASNRTSAVQARNRFLERVRTATSAKPLAKTGSEVISVQESVQDNTEVTITESINSGSNLSSAATKSSKEKSMSKSGTSKKNSKKKASGKWREYTDPKSGRKYYYDGYTSTWKKPKGFGEEEKGGSEEEDLKQSNRLTGALSKSLIPDVSKVREKMPDPSSLSSFKRKTDAQSKNDQVDSESVEKSSEKSRFPSIRRKSNAQTNADVTEPEESKKEEQSKNEQVQSQSVEKNSDKSRFPSLRRKTNDPAKADSSNEPCEITSSASRSFLFKRPSDSQSGGEVKNSQTSACNHNGEKESTNTAGPASPTNTEVSTSSEESSANNNLMRSRASWKAPVVIKAPSLAERMKKKSTANPTNEDNSVENDPSDSNSNKKSLLGRAPSLKPVGISEIKKKMSLRTSDDETLPTQETAASLSEQSNEPAPSRPSRKPIAPSLKPPRIGKSSIKETNEADASNKNSSQKRISFKLPSRKMTSKGLKEDSDPTKDISVPSTKDNPGGVDSSEWQPLGDGITWSPSRKNETDVNASKNNSYNSVTDSETSKADSVGTATMETRHEGNTRVTMISFC